MKKAKVFFCFIVFLFVSTLNSWTSRVAAEEFKIAVLNDDVIDLENALKAARKHRILFPSETIVIDLPRLITVTKAITLSIEDSGQSNAPLIIRGNKDRGTTITGAVTIESRPLENENEGAEIHVPSENRNKIRRVQLGAMASQFSPAFFPRAYFKEKPPGRMFVFEDSKRLIPARWPINGYATGLEVLGSDDQNSITVRLPANLEGLNSYADLWIAGYWGWNWWFEALKVTSISKGAIKFSKPGSPVRNTSRYYFSNITRGLTQKGAYYYSSAETSIYYQPFAESRGRSLSLPFAETLLQVLGGSNIRIESIAFEKSIGPAILIKNGRNVVLTDCYVGHTGADGVVISGGRSNRIENCVIDDVGLSGVVLSGGDRATLTAGENIVRGTRISRFGREIPAYRPGVRLAGVGNKVERCEITDGPHAGIIFDGNNHRIIGNLLHDLVLDTNDAGAIYAGRDLTYRGTVISSNYIYNVTNHVDSSPVVGVYLDDELSGTEVSGNVFSHVDRPILIGGGRDNFISENLFMDVKKGVASIWLDARGLSWQAVMLRSDGLLRKALDRVPYNEPPYTDQYPSLATVLERQPGAPANNRIVNNLGQSLPVLGYDSPKTASFGFAAGNELINNVEVNFPESIKIVPVDSVTRSKLLQTQIIIREAVQNIKNLPFLMKTAN